MAETRFVGQLPDGPDRLEEFSGPGVRARTRQAERSQGRGHRTARGLGKESVVCPTAGGRGQAESHFAVATAAGARTKRANDEVAADVVMRTGAVSDDAVEAYGWAGDDG